MLVSLKSEGIIYQNLKLIAKALMWKCETEFLEVNRKAAMIKKKKIPTCFFSLLKITFPKTVM